MTIDKIKKLIEAGKIDEAEAALNEHTASKISALESKNHDLLGKIQKLKEGSAETIKRLEALEAEKAEAEEKVASKTGDVDKIKQIHQKELDAMKAAKENLEKQLQTHVLDGSLTSALVSAKVAAPLMEAAKALIKTTYKGEIDVLDGRPIAKFDGKAVEEFVTSWAQSDGGKHFVTASNNSGGGANGANSTGNAGAGKTITRSDFDNSDHATRMSIVKEGVTIID